MGRLFIALGIAALVAFALSFLIGGLALIPALVVFGIACTLLLKPSPPPSPEDVPLGGALIATLVLGAAAAPLMKPRPRFETDREALERHADAIENAAGAAIDAVGTTVELGAAYVENIIDTLTDD
jgi:hypothetical protein